MNSYEAYLRHPAGNVLTMEDALRIYTDLNKSIERCAAEDTMELYNEFLQKALEYTIFRNRWEYMSREEKMEMDASRTSSHNSIITAVNILARLEDQEGVDHSWREELGDDRKRIGDFACFVVYITGICNR